MRFLYSLVLVLLSWLLPLVGVGLAGEPALLFTLLLAASITLFAVGVVARVLRWARVPVPFRVPVTCGQQTALPWMRSAPLENPGTRLATFGRMALEVLLFRSLWRNSAATLRRGRLVWTPTRTLWLAALVYHWSLLIVVVRHLRLFVEPVPSIVLAVQAVDGFLLSRALERATGYLQVGMAGYPLTTFMFLLALAFLLGRRLLSPTGRLLSGAGDYFPLLLLLSLGLSGVLLKYFTALDVVGVKNAVMGMLTLDFAGTTGLPWLFYVHIFQVCVLLAYLPFGKLMHAAGIFLSPTRNLANNSRARRHENPWNKEVEVRPYAAYAEEFGRELDGLAGDRSPPGDGSTDV